MTYISRKVLTLKVDFLSLSYTGTVVNNPVFSLSGSLNNTSATLANDKITLYSGSHWRIESSQQVFSVSSVGAICFSQIYSVTNSQTVGFDGVLSRDVEVRGRETATALILSGDISTSEEFQFQVQGTSSQLSASTDPLYLYGVVKIMELPA